jgi:hypothetical protein
MTKNSNSKQKDSIADAKPRVSVIGISNLVFIWILVLVYWCLCIGA